jgi:hypothetical protein
MVIIMRITVFWGVKQCSLVDCRQILKEPDAPIFRVKK